MSSIRLDPAAVRAVVGRWADRDASRTADLVQARAQELAPGHLKGTIYKRRKLSVRGPQYEVGSSSPIAVYVENDTRPHVIRPKRARVLRFQVGGRVVYAKIVHHPGTKGQHFLARAVREVGIRNGYDVRITG